MTVNGERIPTVTDPTDLAALIAALSRPDAYPQPVGTVAVRQTHISVVFLADAFVYKVKKPVRLGFLDFGTPERRRHFCEEEVRLNRRLAPHVYLGVVPVTRRDGRLCFEGGGEPVEWAVKMRRLPDDATLASRLDRDEVTPGQLDALARKLAEFHAAAVSGPDVAAFGRFAVVAGNARENFAQSARQVGLTVRAPVYERLVQLTEEHLRRLEPLIEARAGRGVPRDTHGDLRLDHVYLFPDRLPPEDLVVIDCIEFAKRFRYADPMADVAFPVMDLTSRGRRDLAGAFADAYLRAAGDAEGRALLPFYTAYRAVVRAKVEGIELTEPEVPEAEKSRARQRARAYWLLALGELESPAYRPVLLLVAGLPGTGKSTLARGLGGRAHFHVLRSDVIRKELAGVPEAEPATVGYGQGIYQASWTERTYDELLRRAIAMLAEGERVLIDASFREEERRRQFLGAARDWGVPALLLHCQADEATVRQRLARRRGDASDADWSIHAQAAAAWEVPRGPTLRAYRPVDTNGDAGEVLGKVMELLNADGLV
jgi:aminoglycoside phosphotransferase family enzyme/predicted kinase